MYDGQTEDREERKLVMLVSQTYTLNPKDCFALKFTVNVKLPESLLSFMSKNSGSLGKFLLSFFICITKGGDNADKI